MISLIFSTLSSPGDRSYMVGLYLEYNRLMLSKAGEFFNDQETQEDIVQDSLVKLMGKIDTLKTLEKYALVKYIITTVRRTAINELNSAEKRRVQIGLPNDLSVAEEPFSEDGINLMYRRNMLAKVWPKLPREDQILLESKYILGSSDREIAEMLNCKAGNIRMKLTRARRNAKNLMEGNGYDET